MKGRGNLLQEEKVAELQGAFMRGFSIGLTKRETGVCHVTVSKYFKQFARQGKPRPSALIRRGGPRHPESYRGPNWIGKGIDGS